MKGDLYEKKHDSCDYISETMPIFLDSSKGLAVYGEQWIRTVGEIDSWLAKLDLGLTD